MRVEDALREIENLIPPIPSHLKQIKAILEEVWDEAYREGEVKLFGPSRDLQDDSEGS